MAMGLTRMVKAALASRRLFRNWLWAGMKYFLYKHSMLHTDKVEVACRDGSKDAIPLEYYGDLINRYFEGVVSDYSCRNHMVSLIDGVKVPINELVDVALKDKYATFSAKKLGWSYDVDHGHWFKGNVKFKRMHWFILEVFEFGEYRDAEVTGKVVVDVGAYVGDSAIYFAMRGAEKIIAIEPHPEAYREMLENIKLNDLEGKVIPINAGLASRHGRICLEDVDMSSTGDTYHRPGDCMSNVEAITLGEVLSRYVGENDKPLVLKMDCEGCEYDIILNDYESVRKFDELIFEYHAHVVGRPIAELLSALGRDFDCVLINKYPKQLKQLREMLGMIKCVKKHKPTITERRIRPTYKLYPT